jgi:hypothetical protein
MKVIAPHFQLDAARWYAHGASHNPTVINPPITPTMMVKARAALSFGSMYDPLGKGTHTFLRKILVSPPTFTLLCWTEFWYQGPNWSGLPSDTPESLEALNLIVSHQKLARKLVMTAKDATTAGIRLRHLSHA